MYENKFKKMRVFKITSKTLDKDLTLRLQKKIKTNTHLHNRI